MIELENGMLHVQLSPYGAELRSLRGSDGTEYLWRGDPALWSRSALVLFPCVGRLKGGCYTHRGASYRLPIHGFAPTSMFSVEEWTPTSAVLALEDSDKTRAQYPFRFLLRVQYALAGQTLHARFAVENRGEEPLPFGLGAHPGFRVPLREGLALSDYALVFGASCQPRQHLLSDDCLMSGQTAPFPLRDGSILPLERTLFDRDAIVLSDMARTVTLRTGCDRRFIEVAFPDAPYLAVWQTPHVDAPFICIEPWLSLPAQSGAAAELAGMPTLVRLAAGARFTFRWSVTVGERARRRCGTAPWSQAQ